MSSDEGKVVSLFGGEATGGLKASEDVVELLRSALDLAEAGEIQGVGLAMVFGSGLSSEAFCLSGAVSVTTLVGSATLLMAKLTFAAEGHAAGAGTAP